MTKFTLLPRPAPTAMLMATPKPAARRLLPALPQGDGKSLRNEALVVALGPLPAPQRTSRTRLMHKHSHSSAEEGNDNKPVPPRDEDKAESSSFFLAAPSEVISNLGGRSFGGADGASRSGSGFDAGPGCASKKRRCITRSPSLAAAATAHRRLVDDSILLPFLDKQQQRPSSFVVSSSGSATTVGANKRRCIARGEAPLPPALPMQRHLDESILIPLLENQRLDAASPIGDACCRGRRLPRPRLAFRPSPYFAPDGSHHPVTVSNAQEEHQAGAALWDP